MAAYNVQSWKKTGKEIQTQAEIVSKEPFSLHAVLGR